MRAQMDQRGVRVDRIWDDAELFRAVKVLRAAGVQGFSVEPTGEEGSLTINVPMPNGGAAAQQLAALLLAIGELVGRPAEELVATVRKDIRFDEDLAESMASVTAG